MSGDFIWEFGQNNKKIAEFMTGTKTKPNLCKPIINPKNAKRKSNLKLSKCRILPLIHHQARTEYPLVYPSITSSPKQIFKKKNYHS